MGRKKGFKVSEETKKKLSCSHKGKIIPKKQRAKMSIARKKYIELYGPSRNPTAIPIVQLSIKGIFIREWPSAYRAAKTLDISQSYLWKAINHEKSSSHGFIWKTKKEFDNI